MRDNPDRYWVSLFSPSLVSTPSVSTPSLDTFLLSIVNTLVGLVDTQLVSSTPSPSQFCQHPLPPGLRPSRHPPTSGSHQHTPALGLYILSPSELAPFHRYTPRPASLSVSLSLPLCSLLTAPFYSSLGCCPSALALILIGTSAHPCKSHLSHLIKTAAPHNLIRRHLTSTTTFLIQLPVLPLNKPYPFFILRLLQQSRAQLLVLSQPHLPFFVFFSNLTPNFRFFSQSHLPLPSVSLSSPLSPTFLSPILCTTSGSSLFVPPSSLLSITFLPRSPHPFPSVVPPIAHCPHHHIHPSNAIPSLFTLWPLGTAEAPIR